MSNRIRVIICDRCPTIRYGLHKILGSDSGIEIVAGVSGPEELLTEISEIEADILIIDPYEKDQPEIDFLGQFKASRPNIKIIVFTRCSDSKLVIEVLGLGIQGFKLKQTGSDEIINSIHTVYRGGSSLAPCVTNALLDSMRKKQMQSESHLSGREQGILALVAKGKTNNDIADILDISTRTVKFHISSILTKLNVKNRTGAAMRFVS